MHPARVAAALQWVFLLSYSAVHVHMEVGYWFHGGETMFTKYGGPDTPDELAVARSVYWTKAMWMWLFVVLQGVLGIKFRPALAVSFFAYGIALVGLFPVKPYVLLNLGLATAMCAAEAHLMMLRA